MVNQCKRIIFFVYVLTHLIIRIIINIISDISDRFIDLLTGKGSDVDRFRLRR